MNEVIYTLFIGLRGAAGELELIGPHEEMQSIREEWVDWKNAATGELDSDGFTCVAHDVDSSTVFHFDDVVFMMLSPLSE